MHAVDVLHHQQARSRRKQNPGNINILEFILLQKTTNPLYITSFLHEIQLVPDILVKFLHQPLVMKLLEQSLRCPHKTMHQRQISFHLPGQISMLHLHRNLLSVQQHCPMHLSNRGR